MPSLASVSVDTLPSLASLDGEVSSVLQYVPRHRFTDRRQGLRFLARMFERDLYAPLAFERGVQRLVALGERLRELLAGRRRP